MLSAGDNPDIILQQALAQVGCRSVPTSVGYVDGSWGEDANGAPLHGQLAFAQEFLAGTTDAWRVALTALATGGLYIGGGIAPKLIEAFPQSGFLTAFTGKGRLTGMLRDIPVRIVLEPKTALRGAASRALAAG